MACVSSGKLDSWLVELFLFRWTWRNILNSIEPDTDEAQETVGEIRFLQLIINLLPTFAEGGDAEEELIGNSFVPL